MRNFHEIVNKSYELGAYAAYLSGAGPTIMVFRDENDNDFNDKISKFLDNLEDNWSINNLEIDNNGAIVEFIK